MDRSEILNRLQCFQDPNFQFDALKHKYTYNGVSYTSVTQFVGKFHKPFDTDYWSKRKAEELGIGVDEILKQWKEKNDYANILGTATHEWIENYFNQIWQPLPNNLEIIDRINKFNTIYVTHLSKLEPLCMELRVFSKKYPLAGTIDALFLYKGKIIIVDYKTNKQFTTDEDKCFENLLYPFDSWKKNHLNEYSIQISLYATILKEWGFDVAAGYLLYIGPNIEAKLYRCNNLVETIEKYLPNHKF